MNSSQILYKIKKYKKLQNTSLNGGNYNKIQYKINKYENMLGGELTQDDIEKVSADVKGILETVKDSSSMLGKSIFYILSNIDELKQTITEMNEKNNTLQKEKLVCMVSYIKQIYEESKDSSIDNRKNVLNMIDNDFIQNLSKPKPSMGIDFYNETLKERLNFDERCKKKLRKKIEATTMLII